MFHALDWKNIVDDISVLFAISKNFAQLCGDCACDPFGKVVGFDAYGAFITGCWGGFNVIGYGSILTKSIWPDFNFASCRLISAGRWRAKNSEYIVNRSKFST